MEITELQVQRIAQFIRELGIEANKEMRARFSRRLHALYVTGSVTDDDLSKVLDAFRAEETLRSRVH